jgi:hypothetical protein
MTGNLVCRSCGVEQTGRTLAGTRAVRPDHCDRGRVTAWRDVERAGPEFARRVPALFDAHRHKTIATAPGDGSPRISESRWPG